MDWCGFGDKRAVAVEWSKNPASKKDKKTASKKASKKAQ
jgi:hypothetical protein